MKVTNHLHKTEKRWFAVATKFKCEKYVVEQLSRKGIIAYVPLIRTTKKYESRIKSHDKPLIHCYAFVQISSEEYISVLETDYVIKFIKQRKDLLSIPDKEIQLLQQIVGEYQGSIDVVEKRFSVGQEVDIVAGHLTGLKGRIIEGSLNKAILVELEHIGIQLRIQVDENLLVKSI